MPEIATDPPASPCNRVQESRLFGPGPFLPRARGARALRQGKLRSRQIERHRFRRQVPLGRYIADFVCHEARLIVELDGSQHDSLSQQEVDRSRFLQSEGYRVRRFWNDEVLENPEGVHAMIVDNVRQPHPHPTLPIEAIEGRALG